jgi:complex iron-sulfur molybdoenzyme family reductase subunit gamma
MSRRSPFLFAAVVILLALALRVVDANPALAQAPIVGAWRVTQDPGLDGSTPGWQAIPAVIVPLTAQQTTPPMGGGTVQSVAVRAVHWNDSLYLMLEWPDTTKDVLSDRPEVFADAAAVQFPGLGGTAVPAICMGQADQAVNIWHWRSDTEAGVSELAPGGYVDLYPSTDDLYYPARAAGNPMAVTMPGPVQSLVAGGFGTLTAAAEQTVEGHGVYWSGRWSVVFTRPIASAGGLEPSFTSGTPIDTAFAVWDGSQGQRDGIKSVSNFFLLQLTDEAAPWQRAAGSSALLVVAVAVGIGLAVLAMVGVARTIRKVEVGKETGDGPR